eukprot:TRINITY_DN5168_c0_g1_i4.p1 TRINITY_DN5168_c0_g1~~TRINITY_DN5168_c0_g1_i4.p1  ORF type:complete len:113 (-),score=3.96 TRINITY_DN5168_c0_g1_i4:133-471(-)
MNRLFLVSSTTFCKGTRITRYSQFVRGFSTEKPPTPEAAQPKKAVSKWHFINFGISLMLAGLTSAILFSRRKTEQKKDVGSHEKELEIELRQLKEMVQSQLEEPQAETAKQA